MIQLATGAVRDDGPRRVTPIRDTSAQDTALDPQLASSRRRNKIIALGVAAVLVLVVLVLLIRSWLSAEISVPLERLRITGVTRGTLVRDVSAQGTVVAAASPTLFAPAAGTVLFEVQAGDEVKKGQVLAKLESPELRNELERERSRLASLEVAVQRQSIDTRRQLLANQQASDLAKLNIQAAERELRRAEDSWQRRLISERDYEKAKDDAAAANVNHQHALDTALLQKESLEFELRARKLERDRQQLVVEDLARRVADLEIQSPVDGVVGTLAVAERASVAQNAPLLTVVDLTAFEIEFLVPETYADDLGLGMDAEVTYAGQKYLAKVSAVSPEVRHGQVSGRLRFSAEAPQGLRQNQRVTTRIVLESRENALKVPRGPFLDSGGGRVVYVVHDDIAYRTPIRTGASSIAEVEILAGLAEGDRIIVSSMGDFENAATVRISD